MKEPSIIPTDNEPQGPSVGDWVRVWGQVVEASNHPEDAVVEFFSHNAQWHAHVRLDRIETAEEVPPFVSRCPSLLLEGPGIYVRCAEHDGHGGAHVNDKWRWFDSDSDGRIEDNK